MPSSRKIATTKPATVATSKPATAPKLPKLAAKPATSVPAIAATTTPAPATVSTEAGYRGAARDAAGIVRAATNFAVYSDRDTAYLAFIGSVARSHNHVATLRQIHDAGAVRADAPASKRYNPRYTGSAKATDIGAINRLIRDGYFTRDATGNTLTATAKARTSAAYAS